MTADADEGCIPANLRQDDWYDCIPRHTAPRSHADVPPRPPFDAKDADADAGGKHGHVPRLTIQEALLPPAATATTAADDDNDHSSSSTALAWHPVLECTARAPLDAWTAVMIELIRHPERNSTNILRADVLLDADEGHGDGDGGATDTSPWQLTRTILRRLLPRRPGINAEMYQLCSLFLARQGGRACVTYTSLVPRADDHRQQDRATPLTSLQDVMRAYEPAKSPGDIPFYHPAVIALAYTFHAGDETLPLPSSSAPAPALAPRHGTLGISYIAFLQQSSSPPPPAPALLKRICTSLLKTVHIHTWGQSHAYTPRVPHDRIVPKALFQDVYLNLKHRWAAILAAEWREGTDPDKHVHEDIALAAWLLCFWRQRFGVVPAPAPAPATTTIDIPLDARPWLTDPATWARPPGGFVDVGCGNGLLVWLLHNEGYRGFGLDIRPRKSWDLFRHGGGNGGGVQSQVQVTGADLRVCSLDAVRIIYQGLVGQHEGEGEGEPRADAATQDSTSPLPSAPPAPGPAHAPAPAPAFPAQAFLIGNHADELTPLLPLLASVAVPQCSGLLNIPCCPFTISGARFTRSKWEVTRDEVGELLGIDGGEHGRADVPFGQRALLASQMEELSLGPVVDASTSTATGASGSRNVAYLSYVSHLHLLAGWIVEKEALRIPSTKNWGTVSTRRVGGGAGTQQPASGAQRRRTLARLAALLEKEGALRLWKARDPSSEGRWFLGYEERRRQQEQEQEQHQHEDDGVTPSQSQSQSQSPSEAIVKGA